jgi:transposase
MERRKFTREFKLEAVKLVQDRGVSYARAAEDLGVHPTQLRNWVKQLADDPQHAFPGHGQMKPEQLEIAQLKREVAKLMAKRDIVKKAAAYNARNRHEVRFRHPLTIQRSKLSSLQPFWLLSKFGAYIISLNSSSITPCCMTPLRISSIRSSP